MSKTLEIGEEEIQRRKHEVLGLLGASPSRKLPTGDLRNQFKSSNGTWERIDLSTEKARHLIYKLRLSLGISWNPQVDQIHRISPPFSMKRNQSTAPKVESWVR